MRITVNGQVENLEDGATVRLLVEKHRLQPKRVAVELNRDLVPRKAYAQTRLQEGDCVEIVTLVGGG